MRLSSRWAPAFVLFALAGGADATSAQGTIDLGLPPPSGSQNPVLPPPSGSQNPVLPPQSGQRYGPGIGGRFGGNADIPGLDQGPLRPPPASGSGALGVSGSVSPATAPKAAAQELVTLTDLAPALRRCWNPPPLEGSNAGAMATVRFSLRRDGTLFGQPRVTWETTRPDPALQARFTSSVISAVRDCTPLRLSPQLGASIAGRPFSIRFHGRAPSTERPT
jgi:hypothetical protein